MLGFEIIAKFGKKKKKNEFTNFIKVIKPLYFRFTQV